MIGAVMLQPYVSGLAALLTIKMRHSFAIAHKISHFVVMLILPQNATLFWSSLEEPF
jgi:hypothetical protein